MKKLKITFLLLFLFLPLSFLGCENFNKNTLNTPSNLSVENGVIIFDIVEDAEYYVLNINDTELVLDAKYNNSVELIDNQVNYNANKIFTVGESYSVKVKALAEDKKDSNYTQVFSYKHISSISKPNNIKINGNTLTWDLVKNASFYLVKIVTPYNTRIYDINGNELIGDDSTTIEKAELTAYSFRHNYFNFSPLLTKAGNYNFYINAVSADGSKYTNSGYTNKITYTHQIQLDAPIIGTVKENTDGDLILNAVIDRNTNYITISCNDFKKSIELSNPALLTNIISKNNNELSINLTNYFNEVDFSVVRPYEFKIQAKHIAGSEQTFYTESAYSSTSVFESSYKLPAATISITHNDKHNCSQVEWNYLDITNVSKFNVYVLTSSGCTPYEVKNDVTSMLLPEDFYAVSVQAVGSGNYISSDLSNFKTNSNASNLSNITINKINANTLTWNNIQDANYFIEFNNNLTTSNKNSLEIDLSTIKQNSTPIKLTVIKQGYLPFVVNYNFAYNPQLQAPKNAGFNSSNPYLLTFDKVENAIGYYVKLTSEDVEYEIPHLYTTNQVDLSQYIISENSNETYSVLIKAIADSNSIYTSSEDSEPISVAHQRILSTPTFINNGISKKIEGNQTIYTLNFNGVENAESYEISIGIHKFSISKSTNNSTYHVDVSKYLTAANTYEIKVQAIPSAYAINLYPSKHAQTTYDLYKQLSQVENIEISEHNGVFTLSFSPVSNAASYRVRIVKIADPDYEDKLIQAKLPSNIFEVTHAFDISKYIQWQGEYHVYMTALAPQGGYYGSSDESSTYAVVNKLNSLSTPTDFEFENVNDKAYTYNLSWVGDSHADYYLVNIIDPNGFKYEFNVYGATNTNISKYLTIQGNYTFSVCSMITPNSENSINYSSSSFGEISNPYVYEQVQDFKRYSVSMYGEKYDYEINNVQDLKNILWYHTVYTINDDYKLRIHIPNATDRTFRETLISFAEQSTSLGIYDFNSDSKWVTTYLPENQSAQTSEMEMLKFMCEKLISVFPNMHNVTSVAIAETENLNMFILYYKNTLTPNKTNSLVSTATDYNNFFKYLSENTRRNPAASFAIDHKDGVPVSTSEQLLHAVENGYKPLFTNENSNAEQIYNNAKAVLRTLVNNNMSELEKTTKIYDWLSYAYNINFYADQKTSTDGDQIIYIDAPLSTYGYREEFYLEGMFLNLPLNSNGEFDEVNYQTKIATSQSFSKAFSLMCSIEGIKSATINGTYTKNEKTYNHSWNKVYISTTSNVEDKAWYVVDIAMSESQNTSTNHTYLYYLSTDAMHSTRLNATENTTIISSDYSAKLEANTKYNYYSDASFGLTLNEMLKYLTKNISDDNNAKTFNYSKDFKLENNYSTFSITDLNKIESYLFNIVLYAKYMLVSENINEVSFDFSFEHANNAGNENFYTDFNQLHSEFVTVTNKLRRYTEFNIDLINAEQIKDLVNNKTIVILTFKNK